MSTGSSYVTARDHFAGQFVRDGQGYLYRKSQTGEAKLVTAAERDRFLAVFTYRLQYLAAAAIAVAVLVVFVAAIQPEGMKSGWLAARVAIVCVAALLLIRWAIWSAPARALKARPAVAPALSRPQAHRMRLARLRYKDLLWCVFAGVWAFGKSYPSPADWLGWQALWFVLVAVWALFLISATYGKWRMERADQNPAITSKNAAP